MGFLEKFFPGTSIIKKQEDTIQKYEVLCEKQAELIGLLKRENQLLRERFDTHIEQYSELRGLYRKLIDKYTKKIGGK